MLRPCKITLNLLVYLAKILFNFIASLGIQFRGFSISYSIYVFLRYRLFMLFNLWHCFFWFWRIWRRLWRQNYWRLGTIKFLFFSCTPLWSMHFGGWSNRFFFLIHFYFLHSIFFRNGTFVIFDTLQFDVVRTVMAICLIWTVPFPLKFVVMTFCDSWSSGHLQRTLLYFCGVLQLQLISRVLFIIRHSLLFLLLFNYLIDFFLHCEPGVP